MTISSKGKYGLVALIDICLYSGTEVITLKSISKRQNISERYLEQIFSSLRKGGIISSKKGAQGGYYLAKKQEDITIGEVLTILEGDVKLISSDKEKNEIESFVHTKVWDDVNNYIEKYFYSITLEKLVRDYREEKISIMYYI